MEAEEKYEDQDRGQTARSPTIQVWNLKNLPPAFFQRKFDRRCIVTAFSIGLSEPQDGKKRVFLARFT